MLLPEDPNIEDSNDSGGAFSKEKLERNLCLNSDVILTFGDVFFSSASVAVSIFSSLSLPFNFDALDIRGVAQFGWVGFFLIQYPGSLS